MIVVRQLCFGATARKGYVSLVDRFIVSGTNFLTMVVVGRYCGLNDLGLFLLSILWLNLLRFRSSFLLHFVICAITIWIFILDPSRSSLFQPLWLSI